MSLFKKRGDDRKDTVVISCIFLFALVIIAFGFKIFIAFDPDEQLSFALMYRLCNGQRYLTDISDPYQFSALLVSPFYYASAELGKTILNPVILFRIFSILLNCLLNLRIALAVYERSKSRMLGLLTWLCMITALPKSVLSLEHSNLSLIFLSWLTADLLAEGEKPRRGVLLGIDCSLLSLSLPPLVLLYIPIVLYYLLKRKYACAVQTVLTSVLILAAIVIPILMQGGTAALIHSISLILMDGSHQMSVSERIAALAEDLVFLCKYIAVYTALFGVFLAVKRIAKRNRPDNLIVLSSIMFLVTCVQFVLRPTSPMAGNGRYLLLMILCFILAVCSREKKDICFPIGLYLIAFPLIYVTSNTNLLSASGFLMLSPVLFTLLYTADNSSLKTQGLFFLKLVVITHCITMIMTWRTYGTLPHSIFHFDQQQDSKVLPGLWYDKEAVAFFGELSDAKENLTGDAMIVSSIYSYANNVAGKCVDAPVTVATLVYNEQWETYLSDHPFETVDVIVCKYNNETIDPEPLLEMMENNYSDHTLTEYETFSLHQFGK